MPTPLLSSPRRRLRLFLAPLLVPAILVACGQPPTETGKPPAAPPITDPGPREPGTPNPSPAPTPGPGPTPTPTPGPDPTPEPSPPEPTNPPAGGEFKDERVAQLYAPTDLAFTPDGRMLVTSQTGKLRVYQDGELRGVALDLAGQQCTNYEWGLLGVAVDPQFASNQYIYTYYTDRNGSACKQNVSGPVNRVSRFTLSGDTINPASEKVLIDNIPAFGGNHNGGDLAFGADGKLYVSVGDAFCVIGDSSKCGGQNSNARSRAHLLGKILRINKDGTIPSDNPFVNEAGARNCGDPGGVPSGTGPCAETYAWGLRNPFRMAFKPGTNELYINDVGQEVWDEINLAKSGANYGWNEREGFCKRNSTTDCGAPPAGMTNPIFAYGRHQEQFANCKSITGGAFIPAGLWPREYDNTYLFADYVCGKIFRLTPKPGGGFTVNTFKSGLGESSAVTLLFGPHGDTQALYYLTYADGGEVRRISYSVDNQAPQASASANITTGSAPLTVNFDASRSRDPDGDPLTFRWNFGDGTGATGAKATHTYTTSGTYTARVTVSDGKGGTGEATVRIDAGNTAPQVQILAPTASETFKVGQVITLQGSATDAEDGRLPESRLEWKVELRHNDDHSHPILPPTNGNGHTITYPAPEGLDATELSHVLVTLTATDSRGTTTTITRKLQPRRVKVAFETQPSGLNLSVNNSTVQAPASFTSWEGYTLNVSAPMEQELNGRRYVFEGWNTGGAATQKIETRSGGGTFTAMYRAK